MIRSRKTYGILVGYAAFVALTYLLTSLIIQRTVDNEVTPNSGLVNVILLSTSYAAFGFGIYLILLNLTPIIGLVIARKRGDLLASKLFKILTLVTAGASFAVICYVYK